MYRRYGVIAAHRFADTPLWTLVEQSAKRWVLEPRLIAAVLAVEMLARGAVWRRLEVLAVRILLAMGCHRRVERMSLGIAQIQPRCVEGADDLRQRVRVLLGQRGSTNECARLLAGICRREGIDVIPPEQWSRDHWERVGLAYGGDKRYGEALRAAFAALAPRV